MADTWLIFKFIVEMGFRHVDQVGLEFLTSGDPPTSASQSAGITAPCLVRPHKFFVGMGSCYVAQAGLKFLDSSNPLSFTSKSTGITGMNHLGLLVIIFSSFSKSRAVPYDDTDMPRGWVPCSPECLVFWIYEILLVGSQWPGWFQTPDFK